MRFYVGFDIGFWKVSILIFKLLQRTVSIKLYIEKKKHYHLSFFSKLCISLSFMLLWFCK